jgi:hypothetical protein
VDLFAASRLFSACAVAIFGSRVRVNEFHFQPDRRERLVFTFLFCIFLRHNDTNVKCSNESNKVLFLLALLAGFNL